MNKVDFDVGDRVRVVGKSSFVGDVGRVIIRNNIESGHGDSAHFRVCFGVDFETGGAELYFFAEELERV